MDTFMDTGKAIVAFIAGAAVGAVAALLMAPDSGAKTREKIRDRVVEGLDKVEEVLEEM